MDPITEHIIGVFWAANRGRRYLTGMRALALPLSAKEIGDVVEAYGSPLHRQELDACVLAIDQEFLGAV